MTLAADPGVLADYSWDHALASPARIRNAALRGHDNCAADRAALRELDEAAPGFADLLRAVRSWHVRVVRHLTARGIGQFQDLTAGLPTAQDNTHQTAQRQNPRYKGHLHRHRRPRLPARIAPRQ
ncbi:SAM-dependent methyltransferase [Amycolatopsis sp. H6(2020)]|nr:SAM-dependent methyltransferase [Amycolatopsis sp. H6(2020)]